MNVGMKVEMKVHSKEISLVIVDDEPLVIEGLKSMIDWKKYNIVVTKTFELSELAYDYMVYNPVDLLITDVRMPGMDGLELIQQIKLRQPSLKVLVMSGYRDFEYVKLAMTYGAKNYLVKPVFEEDIEPLLFDIQKEINNRLVEAYYSESGQIEIVKKFLSEKESLLEGPSRELVEYANELLSKEGWLFCAFWKGFEKIQRERVFSIVEESVSEWIELLYQNHGILALVRCDATLLEKRLFDQDYITKWNIHVIQPNIMELRKMYQEYTLILPRCHHYQKNSIIAFPIVKTYLNKKPQDFPAEKIATEFAEIMHLRNKELLQGKIEEIVDQLAELSLSKDIILSTIILLYETIIEKLSKLIDINCITLGVFDINLPVHMCTIEDIVLFFEDKLFTILALLEETKTNTKDSFKVMVENFIDENYTQNITIKEMADYVHMHPTYLGQKLSQLWGEGFTQRLHRIRIQKSVDYLSRLDNISIEDIAFKVGYHHYHVFLKYFKKYIGKTPKEYVRYLKI